VNILAIESCETAGSVAALASGNLLLQLELDPSQRSAQSLAPGLAKLLEQVGWRAADVELVAVGIGPGSFTGLRVGVTSAKTFAYAAGAQMVGVETLEAVAFAAPGETTALSVAIDAQRGQVAAQRFRRPAGDGQRLAAEGPWQLLDIDAWLASLTPEVAVAGPILRKLADRLPPDVAALPREFWFPTAASVGRLGWELYSAGRRDDLWNLLPIYSRRSAAEERRDRG
jgi:tRNA threonylcarbamoyladenosine biosynthesis protein TsaB